jgi:hypothetical protein
MEPSVRVLVANGPRLLRELVLSTLSEQAGISVAGEALGIKSSGSLFVGVLRSRMVEDRLVDKF